MCEGALWHLLVCVVYVWWQDKIKNEKFSDNRNFKKSNKFPDELLFR